MTIELENAETGEMVDIEVTDYTSFYGISPLRTLLRNEEEGELVCFYCKSKCKKENSKEMGIGKDGEMKYVCHKCFKQQEPMRLEVGIDGAAYFIPEGEYVVSSSAPIPAEHFQGTWSDSVDTTNVYENTARYDGGATA